MGADKRDSALTRAAAAEAVLAVEQGVALDKALEERASRVHPDQQALLGELAYGTCRWYHRLAAVAGHMLDKPLRTKDRVLFPLILVGLYQIIHTRIPAHAALAETVEAARLLRRPAGAGLVNALLRRFLRESRTLLELADADEAVRCAYPEWLAQAIRRDWPEDGATVLDAGNERPPMVLRVNTARTSRPVYAAMLAAEGITARQVEGVPTALVLDTPRPVDELPGFRDGLVSVQDAAAQLAAPLLDAQRGHRVLDACAAPGGKTSHIAEITPDIGKLVALDLDPVRLLRVSENLQRLGLAGEVVAGDAAQPAGDWASEPYDRILLDAPCSATGVIRRHPDIKLLRRPGDIEQLSLRQAGLLAALWPLLRPGGILIYCTCSVLRKENKNQVETFAATHPECHVRPLTLPFGRQSGPGWQILPGDAGTDGFFYACLEKAGG